MQKNMLLSLLVLLLQTAQAQESKYSVIKDVPYYGEQVRQSDEYIRERCVLDMYYPEGKKDFATVVWFHGGGLTGGGKELPEALKNQGLCIVGVNYRLSPRAKAPAYIEDAAAAVAWVFQHIGKYGGDKSKIFVSGHSAGGYLTCMVGLDKKWLAKYGVDADSIAGLIPLSAQAITHYTIRQERGIRDTQPIVDEYAPQFHVRADAPPLLLVTGDREMEMLGRYEENAYLARMMKIAGHKQTRLFELQGYGHNMTYPAFPLLLNEIKRIFDGK
ncbi:MAG: alpha/beta hydrolase [Dysgonamonadaceae bacterium]|jgi:acetyl esterase/lipase|nr:alpha/beta hydrolase [Dysgonamonadaceae bacterium]